MAFNLTLAAPIVVENARQFKSRLLGLICAFQTIAKPLLSTIIKNRDVLRFIECYKFKVNNTHIALYRVIQTAVFTGTSQAKNILNYELPS